VDGKTVQGAGGSVPNFVDIQKAVDDAKKS
jgi:hypothetical protein